MAQFPSPFTPPAISPAEIAPALKPARVVILHMKGTRITKPMVTQMTIERAEIRLVPSFMNNPQTPHNRIAKPAFAIQGMGSSSNRKDYDRRQRQNYAAHLYFVQTLAQHDERQYHREQGEQSGDRSDDRSVLLT